MATPNRAPRRTAATMNLNVASGTPVPGANAQTYQRQSVNQARDVRTYNRTPSGLQPGTVAVNKGS